MSDTPPNPLHPCPGCNQLVAGGEKACPHCGRDLAAGPWGPAATPPAERPRREVATVYGLPPVRSEAPPRDVQTVYGPPPVLVNPTRPWFWLVLAAAGAALAWWFFRR